MKNIGIGCIGALQLIFIVLKLCKVIDWSWIVVLIPLWVDIVLILLWIIGFIFYYRNNKDKY